MNNHYAKIRAALELADNFDDAYSTSSERDAKNDAMAAAITASPNLSGWRVSRWRGSATVSLSAFVTAGMRRQMARCHSTPPRQFLKGMFTAKEMKSAYIEGCLTAGSPWLPSALFKRSNTFKLVQERTK